MRARDRRRRSTATLAIATAAIAAVALTTLAGATAGAEPTVAAWQRSHQHQTTLTTSRLNPVPTVSCVAASGALAASVPIKWTAPTSGLAPTSYTVSWTYPGGSGSAATGNAATTANMTGGVLSLGGQSIVTVYATYGSWTSPVSLQSIKVTTLSVLGAIVGWECVQNV